MTIPVHETRGCKGHELYDPWCQICGFPVTHHLPAAQPTGILSAPCLTCGGSGVLVDCHGGSCSHVNDREYPCPACEVAREVGDEPEEQG